MELAGHIVTVFLWAVVLYGTASVIRSAINGD